MSFQFSPKINTDGLILYLDAANDKSYPGSGTIWRDLSKKSNNGNLINSPTYDSSNSGSIFFDGGAQYIECPNSSSLGITGSLTISFWMKSSSDSGAIVSKSSTIFGNYFNKVYEVGILNGNIYFQGGDGTNPFNCNLDATPILDEQWHFITATFNGTTNANGVSLYFDGNIVKQSTSLSSYIQTNNYSLLIGYGRPINDYPYTGNISSVQIYNRCLSTTEIVQNYNAIKGRYNL